jgi:hypothetical protein
MEKIDLDAIIDGVYKSRGDYSYSREAIKSMMRRAIHQALVLASEKATATSVFEHYDHNSQIAIVNKQSILDVERMIN